MSCRTIVVVSSLFVIALVLALSTIYSASALTDLSPSGNINMRGRNITNATQVCFGADCRTTWPAGNASFNQTFTDSLYLNKTDQRYNETGAVSSIGNWSADKSSYLTAAQSNSKFLQNTTCSAGYVAQNVTTSGSQCVAMTVDTNSGGTSNLTLAQVNANMGNYSANPSGFISSVPYQSSAAGWTNTTTEIFTPLSLQINSSSGLPLISTMSGTGQGIQLLTNASGALSYLSFMSNNNANFSITRRGSADKLYIGLQGNAPSGIPSSAIVITGGSNVGVGTDTPTSKLYVNGDSVTNGSINMTGGTKLNVFSADGNIRGVFFAVSGLGTYIGSHTNNYVRFRTGDTDKMTLNESGALGIGTTAPTATLDVRALNTGTPQINIRATPGQTATILNIQDSGGNNVGSWGADAMIRVSRYTMDTAYPQIQFYKLGNTSSQDAPPANNQVLGRIQFDGNNGSFTRNTGAYIQAVTTQAFNSTGAGTDIEFYTTSTNSLTNLESMTIVGTGTVDIKRVGLTITPSSVPVLAGSNTFQFNIKNATTGASEILALGGDNSKAEIQSFNSKPLYINRQGNGVFFPGTNTNIGIGQSTATQRLDVNGSINISGTSGKLYLPNIPGTGNYVCINATDFSLFRNTTCP